jgi:hypothetical protein
MAGPIRLHQQQIQESLIILRIVGLKTLKSMLTIFSKLFKIGYNKGSKNVKKARYLISV